MSCGSGDRSPAAQPLQVFCAASLVEVVGDLAERFEQKSGQPVQINAASSGVLARQILASRVADVFLSANAEWMQRVEAAGALEAGSQTPFASNHLVIVVRRDSSLKLSSACELSELEGLRFLAIGDPAHVPAGLYAKAWMQSRPCGERSLWEQLEGRLSPAPDVRAALAQVQAGGDVAALVYQTDAQAWGDRVRTLWDIPEEQQPEIRYWAGVLKEAPSPEAAAEWMNFLQGEQARERLVRAGFRIPESQP